MKKSSRQMKQFEAIWHSNKIEKNSIGGIFMRYLIKNAAIYTMNPEQPIASGAVIEEERFIFVGTTQEAEAAAAAWKGEIQTIDYSGAALIPGLNDSHMHFLHYGKSLAMVNLIGTKNIEDIQNRLSERVKELTDEKSWIEGEGWNQDYFAGEKRYPQKEDIDRVTGEHPTILYRVCQHIAVLNSAGLAALHITKETAPEYGRLVGVDESGEPNGSIFEGLIDGAKSQMEAITEEQMCKIILTAQEHALEQGLTSVQSDDICYTPRGDYKMLFRIMQQLEKEGRLVLRYGEQCLIQTPQELERFFSEGYNHGWGDYKFRINCIKMIADGSLGARTAYMRKPYADSPQTQGYQLFSKEELQELVEICESHGCPAAIHAIGDGAVEEALDAIEAARKESKGNTQLRHGIVHCQITDQQLIERLKELNITTFIQPIFIEYDRKIAEDRIGKELTSTSYAWKTMNDNYIHTPFGTDCPIERFDTMPNIYAAVSRKNIIGDEKTEFLENQKLTMEQAIRCYTVEGAYAEYQENEKGQIKVGMLADFLVLNQDLFHLKEDREILTTKVMETWIGGKRVFQRK